MVITHKSHQIIFIHIDITHILLVFLVIGVICTTLTFHLSLRSEAMAPVLSLFRDTPCIIMILSNDRPHTLFTAPSGAKEVSYEIHISVCFNRSLLHTDHLHEPV